MHLCAVKLEGLHEQLSAFTWVKAFCFKKRRVIELVQRLAYGNTRTVAVFSK